MKQEPTDHAQAVHQLFTSIAGRYDCANHLLSGGFDFFWRRRACALVKAWKPARILDLATGSGDLALQLRATCPDSFVVGADFCAPMLAEARRKGLENVIVADGMRLPLVAGSFDALTVAFGLRNMSSWPDALREMGRVLRPGGHLLVLDFSVPPPPLRWLYRPYLHFVLPRIAAAVTGQKSAYEYLGASIEAFPHGAAMCALIEGAGFAHARCEPLTGGIVSIYTATRRTTAEAEAAPPEPAAGPVRAPRPVTP